ncbi:MAG: winged helix-turn-helix domain-containing protein, partial [Nocardioides sp.]
MARTLAVPLTLDRAGSTPLGSQIAGQIRDGVIGGRLPVGGRLPSTRALAADLGVSRSVTEKAFDQLAAEGWLEARHGSGTYVAAGAVTRTPHR